MADDGKAKRVQTNAVELVRGLNAAEIRAALRTNEAERQALLILLRVANAAERKNEKN